jgi:hypothetical protein
LGIVTLNENRQATGSVRHTRQSGANREALGVGNHIVSLVEMIGRVAAMGMHIAHLDAERHCRIYWRWVTAANAAWARATGRGQPATWRRLG